MIVARGQQLEIISDVLARLGLSTLNEIYQECVKYPGFAIKDPEARIRCLLQRNCASSSQFRGNDVFYSPARGVWGLKAVEQKLAA